MVIPVWMREISKTKKLSEASEWLVSVESLETYEEENNFNLRPAKPARLDADPLNFGAPGL